MADKVSIRAGKLTVALEWTESGISGVRIEGVEKIAPGGSAATRGGFCRPLPGFVAEACRKMADYGVKTFDLPDITVDLDVLTDFQRIVFRRLTTIPAGRVASYSWLARKVGDPRAVRAVAGALARNPLPLVFPCHRVVGKDRTLHGFSARGGLKTKKYLLDLEGVAWEQDGTVARSSMID